MALSSDRRDFGYSLGSISEHGMGCSQDRQTHMDRDSKDMSYARVPRGGTEGLGRGEIIARTPMWKEARRSDVGVDTVPS
jgi:hypothetical protein